MTFLQSCQIIKNKYADSLKGCVNYSLVIFVFFACSHPVFHTHTLKIETNRFCLPQLSFWAILGALPAKQTNTSNVTPSDSQREAGGSSSIIAVGLAGCSFLLFPLRVQTLRPSPHPPGEITTLCITEGKGCYSINKGDALREPSRQVCLSPQPSGLRHPIKVILSQQCA